MTRNLDYSEQFIDKIFYLWLENNKSFGGIDFLSKIPDENGKKPNLPTLRKWMAEYGWQARADALDAEISLKIDNDYIDKRVEMFKEHAQVGKELIVKARDYLSKNEFKDGNEALRALDLGINTQRVSEGASEAFAKISKMNEDQLLKEFKKLTGGDKNDEEYVDGETTDTVSDEEKE